MARNKMELLNPPSPRVYRGWLLLYSLGEALLPNKTQANYRNIAARMR